MHGIEKVFVFCILVAVLPITFIVIPLYLRHISYADVVYAVTESDIMEINDGISTIFCSVRINVQYFINVTIFMILYLSLLKDLI